MAVISLFLDSSSQFVYLVLFAGRQVLSQLKAKIGFKHSEQTPRLIDKLLKQHHYTWLQVQRLYLTIGPGYYSGLRVGVAIAKTWGLVHPQLTVYVLSSLQLLAGSTGSKMACVWVSKSMLFYQLFIAGQAQGVAVQTNNSALKELMKLHNRFMYTDHEQLSINALVSNFEQLCPNFELVKNLDQLEPNYLRTWL